MPEKHSKYFSPSAASRWINCPASAIINADMPRRSNKDADRGTRLHAFCAENFKADFDLIDFSVLGPDAKAARTALIAAIELEQMIDDPDMTRLELEVPIYGS